nr:MAG TPA: hypothetical protein [Caudoviricetes sp.]
MHRRLPRVQSKASKMQFCSSICSPPSALPHQHREGGSGGRSFLTVSFIVICQIFVLYSPLERRCKND